MSSTVERPRHVGATETELARRAQHVAERDGRADGEDGAVAGGGGQLGAVPQDDAERALGQRLGERLAQRRGAHEASFVACRSGLMRTTSQTSPSFSIAPMT